MIRPIDRIDLILHITKHHFTSFIYHQQGSRTAWVVSTVPWRRTPWVIGVLGRGTDGEVVVVAYSVSNQDAKTELFF